MADTDNNPAIEAALDEYMQKKKFVDKKGNKPWYERPWIREIRLGTIVAVLMAAWTWWHTGEWNPLSEQAKPAVELLIQEPHDFSEFGIWHRTDMETDRPNPIFWDKLPKPERDKNMQVDEYRIWTKSPDGFWYFMRKRGDPDDIMGGANGEVIVVQ